MSDQAKWILYLNAIAEVFCQQYFKKGCATCPVYNICDEKTNDEISDYVTKIEERSY